MKYKLYLFCSSQLFLKYHLFIYYTKIWCFRFCFFILLLCKIYSYVYSYTSSSKSHSSFSSISSASSRSVDPIVLLPSCSSDERTRLQQRADIGKFICISWNEYFEYHVTRRVCDVTLVQYKAGLCHFVTRTIYAYAGHFC